jgi:hypothetical protein
LLGDYFGYFFLQLGVFLFSNHPVTLAEKNTVECWLLCFLAQTVECSHPKDIKTIIIASLFFREKPLSEGVWKKKPPGRSSSF